MKREPILADALLAQGVTGPLLATKKWTAQGLDTLRGCKKFVFDTQAAIWFAQTLRDNPRLIADAQDFAIPPFKQMWVEIPWHAFWSTMTGGIPDPTADKLVGYLYDGPLVRVVAGGKPDSHPAFLPLEYVLHHPMSDEEQLRLAEQMGVSRLMINMWFWGESAEFFTGKKVVDENDESLQEWDKAGLRALRDHHSLRFAPLESRFQGHEKEVYQTFIDGSGGDLRNIVSLLLFMNRTRDLHTIRDFAASQGFIGNKLRPWVSHSVISLKLDPAPMLRMLSAGEGIRRRLHDVRGHFCHNKVARGEMLGKHGKYGCMHGEMHGGDFGEWWEEYEPLKWECKVCGGHRWWRNEHKRGHMEEGVVVQQYAVTR